VSDRVESPDVLDTETRRALKRLVVALADTKRILGIRYSDWLLGAPSVETAIAASAMAQDEWGHARLLYAMLKDFGQDPMVVEHERSAQAYASADPLDRPFEDWAAVVAAVVLVDGALTVALDAFARGRFEPARSRIPKMLAEEEFHFGMGGAWFRRLAESGGEGRERLSQSVDAFLGRTLAWLAPDDEAHRRLAERGLTDPASELQVTMRERIGPYLESLGVDPGRVEAERKGWDPERGRGPGAPGEEAVERARGDRNRELFVE